jgi:hypothetical protein
MLSSYGRKDSIMRGPAYDIERHDRSADSDVVEAMEGTRWQRHVRRSLVLGSGRPFLVFVCPRVLIKTALNLELTDADGFHQAGSPPARWAAR